MTPERVPTRPRAGCMCGAGWPSVRGDSAEKGHHHTRRSGPSAPGRLCLPLPHPARSSRAPGWSSHVQTAARGTARGPGSWLLPTSRPPAHRDDYFLEVVLGHFPSLFQNGFTLGICEGTWSHHRMWLSRVVAWVTCRGARPLTAGDPSSSRARGRGSETRSAPARRGHQTLT